MKKFLLHPLFLILLVAAGCGTAYRDITPHASGWSAPSLSAPDQSGRMVNLKNATKGPWAIVFFYPEADTPG